MAKADATASTLREALKLCLDQAQASAKNLPQEQGKKGTRERECPRRRTASELTL
jgi:hypothetical protein